MDLWSELLKSIRYDFTGLDLEKRCPLSAEGFVSQPLHRPEYPTRLLEEHFRNDDDSPVSSQGYMPYLNKYILDKVEHLLKKICMAMSIEFYGVELEDFFSQDSGQQSGITVWVFLMNSGKRTRGIDKSIITMAIEEVYREIVLKEGYLWKTGQLRRNWKERRFTLKPSNLSYYTGEDRKDCQGNIVLDGNCCVENTE